jgi:hypothetical protein
MIKNILDNLSKNFVTDYLMFFIGFFVVLSGPKLPKIFKDLFSNKFFKVIFLVLIAYKSRTNMKLSIMLTLFYLVVIDKINTNNNLEKFSNRFPVFKEKFATKKQFKFKDSDNYLQKYCKINTDMNKLHYPLCCVYTKNRLDKKNSEFNPKKVKEKLKTDEDNWLSDRGNKELKDKFIKSQNLYDSVKKCFPNEFK